MSVQNATGVGITQETSEEDFTRNRPDHVTVDVPEAVVYSKILPHTARAGSPYYIGDAYEETPPPISQEWRTDRYGLILISSSHNLNCLHSEMGDLNAFTTFRWLEEMKRVGMLG